MARALLGGVAFAVGLLTSLVGVPGAALAAPATTTESSTGPLGYFGVTPTQVFNQMVGAAGSGTAAITFDPRIAGMVTPLAVALQVSAQGTLSAGLKAYASGTASPDATAMMYSVNEPTTQLVVARLGADGRVTIENLGTQAVPVQATVIGYWGGQQCDFWDCALWYHGQMQTAQAVTVADWYAAPFTVLNERRTVSLGSIGVPTDGSATAVVVLLSTVQPAAPVSGAKGDLAVVPPNQQAVDFIEKLPFVETSVAQKVMTVPMGANATVQVWLSSQTSGGRAPARLAVLGWFAADGAYVPVLGTASTQLLPATPVTSGSPRSVDVRGFDGAPVATDAFLSTDTRPCFGNGATPCVTAAVVSLRAAGATASGTINVGGTNQLIVQAGLTTTNTVIAPVSEGTGRIEFSYVPAAGSGHQVTLTAELLGWIEQGRYGSGIGARLTPTIPTTVFRSWWGGEPAGAVRTPNVLGVGGVPATGVSQVLLSVQTWGANAGPTDVTVWGTGRPRTSQPALRPEPWRRDGATLVTDVGGDGTISFQIGANAVLVEVSIVGWFTPFAGNANTSSTSNTAVVGDSITALGRATYYDLNHDQLRLNILGYSGYETDEMRWWTHQIGRARPDNAVINLGTNDFWDADLNGNWVVSPTAKVREQWERMIDDDFPSSCVYLVTIRYADGAGGYNDVARDIAAQAAMPGDPRRVGVIDWEQFVTDYDAQYGLMADFVHPNANGTQALAMLQDYALTGAAELPPGSVFANGNIPWQDYVTGCQ